MTNQPDNGGRGGWTAERRDGEGTPGKPSLINSFVLRTRTLAALRRAGITTVLQARSLSERDLLSVVNVGPKSVADLHRALAEQSLGPEDALSCLALPRPLSDRDEAMCTCTHRARDSRRSLDTLASPGAVPSRSSTVPGKAPIDRDPHNRPSHLSPALARVGSGRDTPAGRPRPDRHRRTVPR